TTFTIGSDYLYLSGETLVFVPPESFWSDGESVRVEIQASDNLGNPLRDGTLRWTFYIDYSPPYFEAPEPVPGNIVVSETPVIRVRIYDELSGVNPSNIRIVINDTLSYSLGAAGLSYDISSNILEFDPAMARVSFSDGESVNVCVINAMDSPQYCSPNMAEEYCWYFFVDILGPRATLIDPFNGAITSCADQGVIILLTDRNGIAPNSILLGVGGRTYTYGSPELSFRNDTLLFNPGRNIWDDGELVSVTLYEARDTLGNNLQGAPLTWQFMVDLSPPYIVRRNPSPDSVAISRTPTITFTLADSFSRVDTSNIEILIDGSSFRNGSPGFTVFGNEVRFDTRASGIIFAREDTVSICVVARDMPDFCPPNVDTLCWVFYISLSGPWATPVEPLDSTYSACNDQRVILTIEDDNGINLSTIRFEINGTVYTINSPEISWSGDTLVFTPSRQWVDGEVVHVRLTQANDNLGNPLENPLDYTFTIDTAPPVVSSITPVPGSIINSPTPIISVTLVDSLSGINEGSLGLYVNGVYHHAGEIGTSWSWELATPVSDGYIVLNTELAGIRFEHNDSVIVCIEASDSPNYCGPNRLDYCWYYIVDLFGPIGFPVLPHPDEITSCERQEIKIVLTDVDRSNGVNFSSVG
ncbi:MAG: hypothetical protein ACPL6C_02185, partial [bacterium]